MVSRGLVDRKSAFITTGQFHKRLAPETASILSNQLSENFGRMVRGGKKNVTVDTCVTEGARALANWLQAQRGSLSFPSTFVANTSGLPKAGSEKILSLTFKEWKALGIRENTFHYLRQRAAKGKPIRVYETVRRRISR